MPTYAPTLFPAFSFFLVGAVIALVGAIGVFPVDGPSLQLAAGFVIIVGFGLTIQGIVSEYQIHRALRQLGVG